MDIPEPYGDYSMPSGYQFLGDVMQGQHVAARVQGMEHQEFLATSRRWSIFPRVPGPRLRPCWQQQQQTHPHQDGCRHDGQSFPRVSKLGLVYANPADTKMNL